MTLNESFKESSQKSEADEIGRRLWQGELPEVTFQMRWIHGDGGYLTIQIGNQIAFEIMAEILGDPIKKDLIQRVSNFEMEEAISRILPHRPTAKILFDHVFDLMKQDSEQDNVKLYRYGNTKLCEGSPGHPYPEL